MDRSNVIRRSLAALILCAVAASVAAQPQEEKFTNLKVLPKDISPQQLRGIMFGFTRALGVKCTYCHVGEEGKPVKPEDFAKDDKPTKEKARVMVRMTRDLNEKYLATLATRSEPPVRVECVTCHRGAPVPRTLQSVLTTAYATGGADSALARYQSLRDRYYGRSTYDFGEAPLAEVAGQLRDSGRADDAARLLALNMEMNPSSVMARRQYSNLTITEAFRSAGVDSGAAAYRRLKSQYGANAVPEELLNDVGRRLLGAKQVTQAIAALKLNVEEHPASGNAWVSLGDAYAQTGDRKLAAEAYARAIELDSKNEEAKKKLDELKKQPKGKAKKT